MFEAITFFFKWEDAENRGAREARFSDSHWTFNCKIKIITISRFNRQALWTGLFARPIECCLKWEPGLVCVATACQIVFLLWIFADLRPIWIGRLVQYLNSIKELLHRFIRLVAPSTLQQPQRRNELSYKKRMQLLSFWRRPKPSQTPQSGFLYTRNRCKSNASNV